MKKLLLILLCLPMIGFGQEDCGNKPIYSGNKFGNYKKTKQYKDYRRDLAKWEECNKNNVSNLENEFKIYFDNNKLETIEGIWIFSYNGTNYMKGAIKKDGDKYKETFLEKYSFLAGKDRGGQVVAEFEETAMENHFMIKQLPSAASYNVMLKTDAYMEIKTNAGIYCGIKVYPTSKSNSNFSKSKNFNKNWKGNGSGFIISKSGHIITNYHVIEDANEIEVEFVQNNEIKTYFAEVLQNDKNNDLSILKINDINFNGIEEINYNYKSKTSDVGTKVYAFGYPFALSGMGKEVKVTDGIISSKTGFDGNITTYQITAPIQGGNSGGPLFDDKGNLIGINSAKLKSKDIDNVGYSIKTNYVLNLIDILPNSIELPKNKKLSKMSLTEQIKEISKYVVLVKVK